MDWHYLVFKTELRANNAQQSPFKSHFGASRFAYNCLLAWTIEEWQKHLADPSHPRPSLTQQSLQKVWTQQLRDTYAHWYGENSKDPYRHAAASLAQAYSGFFSKSAPRKLYPKFKRNGGRQSCSAGYVKLAHRGTMVQVPRIGLVRLQERLKAADWIQRVGGALQDATFSMNPDGRIFISLRYRVTDTLVLAFFRGKLYRRGDGFVGIDLGLKVYACGSDGTAVANPRYYRKLEKKLATAQRRLSKKKVAARTRNGQAKANMQDLGSRSKAQDQARLRVARVNCRIKNKRREFLNQTVRDFVSQNTTIVIEDLNVEVMKVKREKYGKSVSDASLAEFRCILT